MRATILFLTFAVTSLLSAQSRPGISMNIHTEAGTAIAGATVRVERGPSFAIQTLTDAGGKAEVPGLAAGTYSVTVIADGFQQSVLSISVYDVRQAIDTDLTLAAAAYFA